MTGTPDASTGASPRRTLDAMARKYRALVALRARRDGGGAAATRDELRALAAEFPGCLRELDTLGPEELGRRAAAAAARRRVAPASRGWSGSSPITRR